VYKRNTEAISRNRCCRGKAKSIKYYACVFVALIIRHEKSMLLMIFSSVPCLAVLHFSTLFHKWNDFRENFIEHKMCVLLFSTYFVRNTSHFKKNSASSYCKCTQIFMENLSMCI
jgi:hypothetical protein